MSQILSIDPGGMKTGESGIVLLGYTEEDPAQILDSWAVPDNLEGFRRWYEGVGHLLKPDTVVCENFINRNIRGADLSPLKIEGVVQWIWPHVVLSPASGKNTAVPDAAMKRGGYYLPGDHHRDRNEACRHGLRYLKNQRHVPTLEVLFPKPKEG